jgi:hypothetical protein
MGLKYRTFIPIDAQPLKCLENLGHVLFGGALTVCIFDPKQEAAAVPTG